jgi:hypothetical protein
MKFYSMFFWGLLPMFIGSCSSVTVKSDYDRDTDFGSYNNYKWYDRLLPDDFLSKNPLVKKRIIASVDKFLQQKGFKINQQGEVDFIVVVHSGTDKQVHENDWDRYSSYNPWWGPFGGRVEVSHYEEGTLVIDIIDAQERELRWRGLGTNILKDFSNSTTMQQKFDIHCAKILADFPPQERK